MVDFREDGKKTVDDVPIIREFPYVFPKELSGVPPERQVKFRIDLISVVVAIAWSPYRLAPLEMQELFIHL